MAYFPLHICFVLVAAALLGCSPYIDRTLPSAAELEAQAKERKLWYAKREAEIDAELSVWKVECSDDLHGTAERRCSARNGRDLIVTFVDGRGPYVQAGPHWHVDKPSVVRVDKGAVHVTGKAKSLLPADAVVREMLRGSVAYATCYNWPYDDPHHTVNSLAGFKEAHARLLALKSARSPRPTAIGDG